MNPSLFLNLEFGIWNAASVSKANDARKKFDSLFRG